MNRAKPKVDNCVKKNDRPRGALNFFENSSGRTQNTLNKRTERLIKTMEKKLNLAKNALDEKYCMEIELPYTSIAKNKLIATLENVTFNYDDNSDNSSPILHNFNLTIQGPEKIALCGPNGSGKTTLVKLINGTLKPQQGSIKVSARISYLDQKLALLNPELSILDNYKITNPTVPLNNAHSNLARFLFRNTRVLTKFGELSYGEKIRAALATILFSYYPPELLILDEPTNHLDLENLNAFELILNNYQGALIIISHNKTFVSKLSITKTITLTKRIISCLML